MNLSKKRLLFGLLLAPVFSLSAAFFSQPVYAEMNVVAKKWIYAQSYQCFQSGELNKRIERKNTSGQVADTIFPKNGSKSWQMPVVGSAHYFSSVKDSAINCNQSLRGVNGQISGLLSAAGVSHDVSWSQLGNTDSLMKKLGYTAEDQDVAVFKIKLNETGTRTITTLWSTTSEINNELGSATIKVTSNSSGGLDYKLMGSNFLRDIKIDLNNSARTMVVKVNTFDSTGEFIFTGCQSDRENFESRVITLHDNLDQTFDDIRNALGNTRWHTSCTNVSVPVGGIGFSTTTQSELDYIFEANKENLIDAGEGTVFVHAGDTNTARSVISGLGMNYTDLKLDDDEKYDLYYWFLEQAVGKFESNKRLSCYEPENNDELDNSLQEIHLKSGSNGAWRIFWMNMSGVDTSQQITVLTENGEFSPVALSDVIGWFNSHEAETVEDDEDCSKITPIPANTIDNTLTEEDTETDEANCFNSAGALGWIVCPILTAVSKAVNGAYDLIVDPFLEVKVSMFDTTDSGQATYRAWQTFQGIANILFIIAFLIVIFSQLTGVGIDNYGIKRILPQLIIAAVLINMSYIICTLFIDISNILGTALHEFFNNISVAATGTTVGTKVGGALMSALVNVGLGYLAVQSAALWVPVILPSLFIALITMLISIVFVFILLGVRQAGILILTVISPLAFACYMLPNTKPFFDRWRKLLQGLLLVYPICGVLIGGGAFAGKVLLAAAGSGTSGAGFGTTLIAMLLSVVPFFFIPTILRSSMNAMGNIGARISNFGSNLGRTAGNAVGNSQAMKDYRTRLSAGVDRNGNLTALGRSRDNIAKGRSIFSRIPGMKRSASRSAAKGRAAYLKDLSDQKNEERLNDPQYMAAQIARQDAEQLSDEIKTQQMLFESNSAYTEGNWSALSEEGGLVEQVLNRGNKNEIAGMVNAMSRDDHTRNALEEVLKRKTEAGAAGSLVNADGTAVSEDAANTIRSTKLAMTQNAGAWKAGDRQGDMWSTKDSLDFNDYGYGKSNELANKLSANYMINSDDQAIDSIAEAMSSSSISDETKEKYQSYAYEALHSDGAENMKEERKVQLEKIAGNYRPPEVLKVEHDQRAQYDEDSALRRGRTSQTFSYRDQNTGTTVNATEQLYAVPDSFHTSIAAGQTQDAGYSKANNGDTIYTRKVVESATGKVVSTQKWNATTGKYMS